MSDATANWDPPLEPLRPPSHYALEVDARALAVEERAAAEAWLQRVLWYSRYSARAAQVLEHAACGEDFGRFCDRWVEVEDPRLHITRVPMVLYPHQRRVISEIARACARRGAQVVVEKSREMGISWLICAWIVWRFIYHPGFGALFLSRTERAVDDGTTDSLLGKCRYILEHLPPWLAGEYESRHLHLETQGMGAYQGGRIAGEGSSDTTTAGTRQTIAIVDEAALLPRGGYAIRKSLTSVARSCVWISTPRGASNAFAQMARSGSIPRVRVHWSEHPHKRCSCIGEHVGCWYAATTATMPREDIASELEIAYEGSVHGALWPQMTRAAHYCADELAWRRLEEGFGDLWAGIGIDPGIGPSATAIVFAFFHPAQRVLYLADYLEGNNVSASTWAERTVHVIAEWSKRGIPRARWDVYMDPAGWQRDPQQLRGFAHWFDIAGLSPRRAAAQSARGPIQDFGLLLEGRTGRVLIGPRCGLLYERLANSRWRLPDHTQYDAGGMALHTSVCDLKPAKDESSHGRDALMNLVAEWCAERGGRAGRTQM